METDSQLQRDVADELRFDVATCKAEIGVAARGGVVTLTGRVSSYSQKLKATRAVERVDGVRAIADELKVHLANTSIRSDTDIAHQAASALQAHAQVPQKRVTAKVEHSWVTLTGEVDWEHQRRAAEERIRGLMAVRGVFNHIVIRREPKISADEVRARIAEALRRTATLEAARIGVDAKDGNVVLRGTLRSWTERRDAEHAAWAAPGVRSVEDLIAIEG